MSQTKKTRSPQTQKRQLGTECLTTSKLKSLIRDEVGSRKLKGKLAFVPGGDSGIGEAKSIAGRSPVATPQVRRSSPCDVEHHAASA